MHLEISGNNMTIHVYSDSFGEVSNGAGTWPFELEKLQNILNIKIIGILMRIFNNHSTFQGSKTTLPDCCLFSIYE